MKRTGVLDDLRRVVGPRAVIDDAATLLTYEADGCVLDTHAPNVVVLPATTEETAEVVRIANRAGMPIVPRGAGTGLAGGATPIHGGIVISTARMERVLEVDVRNRRARVQPGVINWELSQYLTPYGYAFYARSIIAKSMHDRWEYRKQQWRSALSQIWHDDQPRAGVACGAARWQRHLDR